MANYGNNFNNSGSQNGGQQRERQSVSTRCNTYKNSNIQTPCALEVTYNDEMIRLSFIPPLPQANRGENRLYDYEHPVITALNRVKCTELYTQYQEIIKPALKEKRQEFVSVDIGTANQIGISTGVNLGTDGEVHPCIILIRNLDPTTKKSNDIILYEFVPGTVRLRFNPVTGQEEEVMRTNAELECFMEDLKTCRDAMSKAFVHAQRLVERSYKDMVIEAIRSIQDKMGIERQQYHNNKTGGGTYNASSLGYGSIFAKGTNDADDPKGVTGLDGLAEAMMFAGDNNEEGLPFN